MDLRPIRFVSGHARANRSAALRNRRPAAANNAKYRFTARARARLRRPYETKWRLLLIFALENGEGERTREKERECERDVSVKGCATLSIEVPPANHTDVRDAMRINGN